ncbi:MAG: DUF2007 domain-containing protein [Armatimonadota bacterium]
MIFRSPDEFTANIVKGLLESEGIPVELKSRMAAMFDGALTMGEGYWGDVVVPVEYAEKSKELIEAYQANSTDNEVQTGNDTPEE